MYLTRAQLKETCCFNRKKKPQVLNSLEFKIKEIEASLKLHGNKNLIELRSMNWKCETSIHGRPKKHNGEGFAESLYPLQ